MEKTMEHEIDTQLIVRFVGIVYVNHNRILVPQPVKGPYESVMIITGSSFLIVLLTETHCFEGLG